MIQTVCFTRAQLDALLADIELLAVALAASEVADLRANRADDPDDRERRLQTAAYWRERHQRAREDIQRALGVHDEEAMHGRRF